MPIMEPMTNTTPANGTRKLQIMTRPDGRFIARVYWFRVDKWELEASATWRNFPVALCVSLNDNYGDRWIMELSTRRGR